MPSSIVAAGISGLFAGSTIIGGLSIGFSWGAFASSLVMSGLSAALRPDAPSSQPSSITSSARTVTTRQAISPWRVIYGRTRVGGVVTYKHINAAHTFYYAVLTFAGHPSEAIDEIYFNDELVPLDSNGNATGKYADHVTVQKSLGNESVQPFPGLVTATNGEWSDAHRQTGHTKIYIVLVANNDLFPAGLPNITAVIRGKNDIYDPRDGSTGYSDNPALCTANYLTDRVRGLGAVYATAINETELVAAANACDETVTLADGTTEKRYTCNGSITTAEKPVDIIPKLASAMAGHVTKIGSAWNIHAGTYDTPTITLTETDLAGAIGWQSLVSRRESCNGVKGIYVEPGNLWQPADFPAVVSDTARAEDNDESIWHDLRLEMTDSGSMAQRIAKIDLLRTRQPLTVSFPGKLSAFRAQPGKTVLLTIDKYGWSAKPFWVAGGSFAINADGTLGYHLSLRETAAAIYDWSTDEEQTIDLAPNTSLDDPFTISAPGVPEVLETLYETTGSAGVKARAIMSWLAVDDGFLLDYLPEYRIAGGTWIALPPTADTFAYIDDIAPGRYDFRLRARTALLSRSEYSGTRTREILGLTEPPSDVSGFTVVAGAGRAQAVWTLHADLDVRQGGRIYVRHTASGTGWEDGIDVANFSGAAVSGDMPLLAGTYLAKAIDSSGNWSSGVASFAVSEASATGWSTVATVTESPAYAGTKTGTVVSGTDLQIDSDTLVDDLTDLIDDWPSIDAIGGLLAAGSYAFASTLDLTTAAVRNVIVDLEALSFDAGDLVDARTVEIDYWDDVDGAAVNDCSVTPYIRTTPDDPAGSPTWSEWTPFFNAEFDFRGAQFRLDFASGNRAHNIAVSTLIVRAREPA